MKNNQITLEVNSKKLLDFIYSLELDIVNQQTLIVLIKEYATTQELIKLKNILENI